MNIDQLISAIEVSHVSKVPIFVWGPRGLGKSTAPRTYCETHFHFYIGEGKEKQGILPYHLIDMRASQMEAPELRGLPKDDIVNNRFVYLPPADLPQQEFIDERGNLWGKQGDDKPEVSPFYIEERDKYDDQTLKERWPLNGAVTYQMGILFLDEPNRGEDDVLQALFQLVLDRKCGGYSLPSGFGIVAAGNPSNSKYRTNTMVNDAAWSSRWCHVAIERSDSYANGWVKFMYNNVNAKYQTIEKVTQFCSANIDHLCPAETGRDEQNIEANPRAWEFVCRVEDAISDIRSRGGEVPDAVRRELIHGLVGSSIANSYFEWNARIYPREIIEDGAAKHKNTLNDLMRSELQGLTWGIANLANSMKNPQQKVIDNVISYGRYLADDQRKKNRDLAVAFFRQLTDAELDESLRGLSLMNPSIRKLMKKTKKTEGTIWYNELAKNDDLFELVKDTTWGNND